MYNKPLVSILIPTYKSDSTLLRAIDSALHQSYQNIEVIVVDDNNPDSQARKDTELLMKKYENVPNVIYIKHSHNKNGSAARNTAFKHSKGEYISFLDDDDYYLKDKVSVQVEFMESKQDIGATYCWRNVGGKDICGKYSGDLTKEILSLDFSPTTPTLMVRRECYEALGGFDESFRRHQDFEFLIRFFERFKIDYVPSVQVVISTNGVNNIPKGQKLIDLKEYFFTKFSSKIDQIKKTDYSVWKRIYLKHYVSVFKDLLRYGYPVLAFKIYCKFGFRLGFSFWKLFFEYCLKGQKERLQSLLNFGKHGQK